MSEQMTMSEFVAQNGIRMTGEPATDNPNMSPSSWAGSHYKVKFVILRDGKRHTMTTYFSMGKAYNRGPEADEVLNCLASDSQTAESGSYSDFLSDFGYGDSPEHRKTYKACQRHSAKLKQFLGEDVYETLLYKVEPL